MQLQDESKTSRGPNHVPDEWRNIVATNSRALFYQRPISRRTALAGGLSLVPSVVATLISPAPLAAASNLLPLQRANGRFGRSAPAGSLPVFDGRPDGPEYVRWEDLVQSSDEIGIQTIGTQLVRTFEPGGFQTVIARCPRGKIVTFPAGVFEINQPGWNAGDEAACQWPKSSGGAIGNVPPGASWGSIAPDALRTVFRVKANTAPQKNVAGKWFRVGYSGSVAQTWANIHFEGTDQGNQSSRGTSLASGPGNDGTSLRVFTNVFFYKMENGSTARDLLSTGWFGNNGAPPGETFGIQWYHSTRGILCRCSTDGRRSAGGPMYGAVGITLGNALECVMVDCKSYFNGQAGLVLYQSVNCRTYNTILGSALTRSTNHVNGSTRGSWLNHERTSGTEHYNISLRTYAVGRAQVVHVTHSGDDWVLHRDGTWPTANGSLKLINPSYSKVLFGGKLTYGTWGPNYGSARATISNSNPPITRTSGGGKVPAMWDFEGTWRDI